MGSSPMRPLGRFLGLRWYWADRWFVKAGLVVWTGKRHVRVLPWPKRFA